MRLASLSVAVCLSVGIGCGTDQRLGLARSVVIQYDASDPVAPNDVTKVQSVSVTINDPNEVAALVAGLRDTSRVDSVTTFMSLGITVRFIDESGREVESGRLLCNRVFEGEMGKYVLRSSTFSDLVMQHISAASGRKQRLGDCSPGMLNPPPR